MERANLGAVGNRARQFRQHFAEPLDATHIRYPAALLFIRSIEISASALGDFDDRVVVFL